MERRPLVIIGAGPAGTAAALFLHAESPALARETLLLEKACHPRPKVCAGGLIPHTLQCLRELDVPLSVPHVVVQRAGVEVPGRSVSYEDGELCRVVRRDEFDHSLVRACQARGVEVRQSEKVIDLVREGAGVRIETERASYHTRAVVGADGSGSVVRRRLIAAGRECVGRAVMSDVPLAGADWTGFLGARYDFNFTAVPHGLRGYQWAFPCVIGGEPHVNVGVYSLVAAGSGPQLTRLLQGQVARLGAAPALQKAFPIRWYARGVRLAAPHTLLVGDAAGVDPLMGEGISFAFEYGRRAAAAATRALASNNFDFADYEGNIGASWMGKKLRRLDLAARLFYGPTWRLWFAIAAHSRYAQDIGIRWYNGIDGWDQRSGWEAARAWLRGDLAKRAREGEIAPMRAGPSSTSRAP
jgi:flavin-dependent dehydrogenase